MNAIENNQRNSRSNHSPPPCVQKATAVCGRPDADKVRTVMDTNNGYLKTSAMMMAVQPDDAVNLTEPPVITANASSGGASVVVSSPLLGRPTVVQMRSTSGTSLAGNGSRVTSGAGGRNSVTMVAVVEAGGQGGRGGSKAARRERCLWGAIVGLSLFAAGCVLILVGSGDYGNIPPDDGGLVEVRLPVNGAPCTESKDSARNVCLSEECVRTASSLLSAMDHTADPCVDFFQYACGTWNKMHVIPEDKSSISTFEVMADQLQIILKGVLEEPISLEDNEATIKAKQFYNSCMDLLQIRKINDAPLRQVLQSLGGWPVAPPSATAEDWQPPTFGIETLLGMVRGVYNEGVLIEQWVGPDDKNSSANIIQLDQMQLALPSRDYYLKASSAGDLQAYHKYMTQIAILLGANKSTAAEELRLVVEFERELANASLPEADRHDTSAIYKKLTLAQLQKIVPEINWLEYLRSFLEDEINEDEPVVAYGLSYFIELGKVLARTDKRITHNYVLWRLIMTLVPHMIDDYQRERVEFRKILVGILSERNRWSQCVEWTNKRLGMAVGALFIRENFNHDSKETALEMIHTIRAAFNELLAENVWMDDETRTVAKEKADEMNERIGYPQMITDRAELIKEYSSLNITSDKFMVNILNVLKYDAEQNLQKLRQPVDKDKWSTEPAVVNAFYNPNKNDIVFPAGILQPLFYSQHFPKSLNYGGIGVVIGHEITHGFDDKGRQFDKDGNMMQWWNNATIRAFRDRAQCIIDQYSRYKIDEVGLYVNGRMTQGENIADNGGLKQSFRAYRKWVSVHGPEPDLPGLNLTHDQLFFLNYAQIWCGTMRPEDALTKVRSSVHSPGPVRVLGPLSNSQDFARAFDCPLGAPMNPTNKCSVW